MTRSYDNSLAAAKKQVKVSIPVSEFVQPTVGSMLLHARVFPTQGEVKEISIAAKIDGKVRIVYELEKVRSNQLIRKEIEGKDGANNMGGIKVAAGDRLTISYTLAEEEVGYITEAWVSYVILQ